MHSDHQDVNQSNDLAAIQAVKLHAIMDTRDSLFGSQIFGDPAWNILIDLFIAYKKDRRSSVSDVCVGSQSPQATCLRYIALLTDAELVYRQRDPNDKRRVFIVLTGKAIKLLTDLFERESNCLREDRLLFDHTDAEVY